MILSLKHTEASLYDQVQKSLYKNIKEDLRQIAQNTKAIVLQIPEQELQNYETKKWKLLQELKKKL